MSASSSSADPNHEPAKVGEEDFVRLLMQHEPVLRAYARSLLPDWQSVDEVIQEASVTLWKKLTDLRDEGGFLPWAKVVVRFKCLSAVSAMRRDRHVFSDGVLEMLANEAESLTTDGQTEAMVALRSCLGRFSSAHRELLLAPYSGHGRITKLAESSGRSSNALYKLLGRLREKLSDCIHQDLAKEVV